MVVQHGVALDMHPLQAHSFSDAVQEEAMGRLLLLVQGCATDIKDALREAHDSAPDIPV